MEDAVIRGDAWLSGLFGWPVFAVRAAHGPTELTARLRAHVGEHPRPFYYAKVEAIDVPAVLALTAAGMGVVEVNVTFGIAAAAVTRTAEPANGVDIREATAADAEDLLAVAETSFRYSRFHLDPLVSDDLANRIKREWIASYLAGRRGECLWTVRAGGCVAGFLAVIGGADDGVRHKTIDLVAVAAPFRARGVGRAIVDFFLQHYAPACDRLRVGTQVANVPSTRLYEAAGMRTERAQYVLHMHVPESGR